MLDDRGYSLGARLRTVGSSYARLQVLSAALKQVEELKEMRELAAPLPPHHAAGDADGSAGGAAAGVLLPARAVVVPVPAGGAGGADDAGGAEPAGPARFDFSGGPLPEAQRTVDAAVVRFGLNAEQERAVRLAARGMPLNGQPALEHVRLLLVGGPGTGKSHVLLCLLWLAHQHGMKASELLVTAYAARAARLLYTGTTLNGTVHSQYGIPVHRGRGGGSDYDEERSGGDDRDDDGARVGEGKRRSLAEQLRGVSVMFIDECYMLPAAMLVQAHNRTLQAHAVPEPGTAVPFGRNVWLSMLSGDAAQLLAPVGYNLPYGAASEAAGGAGPARGRDVPPVVARARALLEQYKVIELTQQMRALNTADGRHLYDLSQRIRNGGVTDADISDLSARAVTPQELAGMQPPLPLYVTPRNVVKDALNWTLLRQFAYTSGRPLYRWFVPLGVRAAGEQRWCDVTPKYANGVDPFEYDGEGGGEGDDDDDEEQGIRDAQEEVSKHHSRLYAAGMRARVKGAADIPEYGAWCANMSLVLRKNLAVNFGLTNNTRLLGVDLIEDPESVQTIVARPVVPGSAAVIEERWLSRPPLCMVVRIAPDASAPPAATPSFRVGPFEEGCVPIMPKQATYRVKEAGVLLEYRRTGIPLQLGFAFTDYFMQGTTAHSSVIFDMQRPPSGRISAANMYVMLTRVRSWSDVHLLRPLWRNTGERAAEIRRWRNALRLSPDVLAEIKRLEAAARATA